jgi:protoporphyrinogen oxidase
LSASPQGDAPARHVAVVGAGVGGMAAAIHLAEAGHRVSVFDPASVAGGLASGLEVGGTSVERFYHHLFRSDLVARKWIADLGLGGSLEDLPATMGFYTGGRLRRFGTPVSLLTFSPLRLRDRVRLGLRIRQLSATPSPEAFENITAMDWLRGRASLDELEVFWIPLLEAKFGSDRDLVSMAWLWARFRARVGGSVGKPERLGYLRGGFQQLGDRLVKRATDLGVDVGLNTRVLKVIVENGAIAGVETDTRGVIRADAVLWTPSLNILAKAVPELDEEFRHRCAAVRYHHAIVMVVELQSSVLPYYWVTVGDKHLPFTVAVEHTHLVGVGDYSGRTVVYLGRYAAPEDPIVNMSDDEIRALFLGAAAEAFSPGFATPLEAHVFRAPAAQPILPPGWATNRPSLRTGVRGLVAANMAQIYPWDRGINYSIELGVEAAGVIQEELAAREALVS